MMKLSEHSLILLDALFILSLGTTSWSPYMKQFTDIYDNKDSIHIYILHKDTRTDTRTDRQTNIEAHRQTHSQTDRQADRQMDRKNRQIQTKESKSVGKGKKRAVTPC